MKKLVIVSALTMFLAAASYIPLATSQMNPYYKGCCRYERQGRVMYRWMTMGECKNLGGGIVAFAPGNDRNFSPKAHCNSMGNRLQ